MDVGAKLDRMANGIADYFRSYPGPQGVAGVREHIVAFWSPVMRRDLAARIASGEARLDPLVLEAMEADRSGAASPAAREAAGPEAVGQMGADDAG